MPSETSPLRVPAILITMVLVGALLKAGKFIFLPLIVALLLCLVSRPLVAWLERRRVPSALTVFALMVLFVVAVIWVGGQVFDGASAFLQSVNDASKEAQAAEVAGATSAPAKDASTIDVLGHLIHEHVRSRSWGDFDFAAILDQMKTLVPRVAAVMIGALGVVQDAISQTLLVVLFMVFIFAEQGISKQKILLAAGGRREEIDDMLTRITDDVEVYLGMKTLISLATGLLCWGGLVALGVPYASLFAVLAFLLNFIPNVGSILAAIFPAGMALGMEGGGVGPALGVLAIYGVVNVVLGNLVEPKVLGKQLNLSPLVILIALLFWGALWGIAGMFLAVPLTRSAQLVFLRLPNLQWLAILMANEADESLLQPEGTPT